jgi:DNA repair protein RadC
MTTVEPLQQRAKRVRGKRKFCFADSSDANKYEVTTIYRHLVREVKVATVREAPAGSYAVIVMHNHPSGDPSPSQADHSLTRRLAEAAELLQIKLLDHVVIGDKTNGQGYFSFKEAGVL